MAINLIKANWLAPKNVVAFSTTRAGGVSLDQYGSLNLGDHVGDDPLHVEKNRALLSEYSKMPSMPAWLKQVHSTEIVDLDARRLTMGDKTLVADGSTARTAGTICVVMTADCLPLLLCNKQGTQVAALHAGWKGMADGIIEAGVQRFDCAPEDIIAWAGPTIGPKCFEIGEDVRKLLGGSDQYYKEAKDEKYFANLYGLAQERLNALGVIFFTHSDYCTYSNEERFYSYRRDGVTGRQASFIYLNEA